VRRRLPRGRKRARVQRSDRLAGVAVAAADLPRERTLSRFRPTGGCPRRTRAGAVTSVEVDAYPESRVHNSQPHGIGRVAALDGLWAWNNLGRNVVFAGEDFSPRAVFDESVFSEDEPSQY